MAKRVADTQITKDGLASEDDGFSVGSQMGGVRRATAAQMAARTLAKPRGNRRPGTSGLARPSQQPTSRIAQPQLGNSNSVNGAPQQETSFSFLNGNNTNQPNQTSQSFPPFGTGSNSTFNTQFSAPSSSGFNFQAGPPDDQNPFVKHFPVDTTGFQGSIFNVRPQETAHSGNNFVKEKTGDEVPQFAAHSPFHNGNQEPTSNLTHTPSDSAGVADNQHQPSQVGPSAFSPFQQQTPNNIFAIQQPASSNESQSQQASMSSSNIFGQGNSVFKQPQQESQVNTPNNTFGQNTSLFRPAQAEGQANTPGNIFGQNNAIFQRPQFESQATNPGNGFGQTSNIFQQQNPAQQSPNLFGQPAASQPTANFGETPANQGQEDQSMMSTSPDTSPSSQAFGSLNGFNNNPQLSPTKNSTAPTGGSLFDRVSRPESGPLAQASQNPFTNTTTQGAGTSLFDRVSKPIPESSTPTQQHPSMFTPSSGNNNSFGGASRPAPVANMMAPSGIQALPSSTNPPPSSEVSNIFSGASKPAPMANMFSTSSSTSQPSQEESPSLSERMMKPTTETPTQSSSSLNSNSPFKIPSTLDASSSTQALSGVQQPAKKKLFGQTLPPQTSQPSFDPKPQPTHETASESPQSEPSKLRKAGEPPDPPDDFTDDEKVQFITGWRLKHLDACMRRCLEEGPPKEERELLIQFYYERVGAIHRAKGGPVPNPGEDKIIHRANGGPVPNPGEGQKRKAEDQHEESDSQSKRARTQSSPRAESEQALNEVGSANSQTASLFKNILGNKGPEAVPNGVASPQSTPPGPHPSSNSHSSNTTSTPSMFQAKPLSASSMQPPPKPPVDNSSHDPSSAAPQRGVSAPSSLNAFTPTSNGNPASVTPSSNPQTSNIHNASVSGSSNIFTVKTTTSSTPSAFGPGSSSNSASPSPFSIKPTTSFKPPFIPPKATPQKTDELTRSDTSKVTSSNAPKPPVFKPTFSAGTSSNFIQQFGKAAEKTAEETKQKRKLEEFDSDEEDEASWERRYDEEQRAKKQKYEKAIDSKSSTPKTSPSKTFKFQESKLKIPKGPIALPPASQTKRRIQESDFWPKEEKPAEEEFNDDEDEESDGSPSEGYDSEEERQFEKRGKEAAAAFAEIERKRNEPPPRPPPSTSVLNQPLQSVSQSNNIFGHLVASKADAAATKAANADDEENEADEDDASTPAVNPQRNTPSLSLFDRITKDDKGNPVREISKENTKPASQASGLFGRDGANAKGTIASSGFATSNYFGRPQGEASASTMDRPANAPQKNIFGQASAPASTNDKPANAPSKHVFGQASSPTSNESTNAPQKHIFGQPSTSNTEEPAKAPQKHIFGQVSAPASTSGKPAETPQKYVFGQPSVITPRQSTFGNVTSSTSAIGATKTSGSPTGDNTWKADSPIKFGDQGHAPTAKMTAADTPTAPFIGLFGSKTNPLAEMKPIPNFSFASPSPTKATAGNLGFGFTPAKDATTNSFGAPSNTSSLGPSRGTSPGAATGDSANDSGADQDGTHAPLEPQLDLADSTSGEEDEFVIHKVSRVKAYRFDIEKKMWVVKGNGPLRMLEHKEDGKVRIVLRHHPSGRIVVNTYLNKSFKYENPQEKTIRVPIVEEDGKIASWMFKVESEKEAKTLTAHLQQQKIY